MKIVTFRLDTQPTRVGALADDAIIDLHRADERIQPDLLSLIQAGQPGLDLVRALLADGVQRVPEDAVHRLEDVTLTAPWPGKRIAMAGANYAQHVFNSVSKKQTAAAAHNSAARNHSEPAHWTPYEHIRTVEEMTEEIRRQGPWGFWKTLDWVTNPGDEMPYPRRSHHLDYEGEVAIIFSKPAKDIKASDIGDYVWGVTLANDWSDRDETPPGRLLSYNLHKNFDGSLTIGPCIVVDELEPQDIDVTTRVNGEVRQRYNTSEMVFSFGECAEALTRDLTLVAGDMLGGGTNAGTATDLAGAANKNDPASDHWFLHPGDVVEVASPQIGAISNTIVAAP
jgi:2-keto-4-pentenoate hydratase/2-oxohepta-3-ene-1,7-dioic acid hydratase in catechol pathway